MEQQGNGGPTGNDRDRGDGDQGRHTAGANGPRGHEVEPAREPGRRRGPERGGNTSLYRNVGITAALILGILAFSFFSNDHRGYAETDTSVAFAQLNAKNVKEAQIDDREQRVRLTLKEPVAPAEDADPTDKVIAEYPERVSDQVFSKVAASGAEKYDTTVTEQGFLVQMLQFMLPMLLLLGLLFFFMSRMQGGAGGLFGVGKSRAVEVTKDMPRTTFADVAGEDEAVEELNEIKDFLQHPARYERLGAKIPRGVLLYGPPGTGKTLLARAVAGEAGVPFYSISGSDFVEMFVGVGASRVRDLFEKAKQNSPCIVFVDEIDAVGRQRGAGMGGGHDEREQTLNQLLVEMDGFDDRETVILIAATNRPDVLDPALLRPGRFDRQVPVVNPDLRGRRAILGVHSKGKPLAEEVNLDHLAKRTIGMSGADLANVLNEGALLAARLGRDVITNDILDEATDRVVGGPRRKHRVISEHEKKVTAYHESGHALAAWAMEDLEPVHKVTILARGRTGGHALVVPEDDKSLMTRADMIARIVMAMGGRAAEEYVFGEPTSGASSDIEQATKIARSMVTEYGMSSRLGAVKYGDEGGDPFLGRGGSAGREYSDEVAKTIDDEVRRIVDAAQTEAWKVLDENRDILDACAAELLEKETLRQDELERIFADVVKRPRITEFNDFGGRTPSTREPIKTPGELAKERGEPWPPPVTDPFAMPAPALSAHSAEPSGPGTGFSGGHGDGSGDQGPGALPRYGTPPPPGWSAPGWPPRDPGGYHPGHRPPPYLGGQPTPAPPEQSYDPAPRQAPSAPQPHAPQPHAPSAPHTASTPEQAYPVHGERGDRAGDGHPGDAHVAPPTASGGPGAYTPSPSASETARLPALGDERPRAWSDPRDDAGRSPSAPEGGRHRTGEFPRADGGDAGAEGPRTGSHRREDRGDDWRPPWERGE